MARPRARCAGVHRSNSVKLFTRCQLGDQCKMPRARPLRSCSCDALRSSASALLFLLFIPGSAFAQAPVTYRVSFPPPQHHYADVEIVFADLPAGPLELRMSRSSPGRYALHEFAKNVFDVRPSTRPARNSPSSGRTRISGTCLSTRAGSGRVQGVRQPRRRHLSRYRRVACAHEHAGDPDVGARPRRAAVRITFVPPAGSKWKPATQLFPTSDPWTFTAPNLQYLMDSPTELSDQSFRSFKVRNPDGREQTIVTAVHHDATDADIDEYVAARRRSSASMRPSSASCRSSTAAPTRSSATTCRGAAATAWSTATARSLPRGVDQGQRARRARHGLARVLSRLERRAHPSEVARAVQFRGREHVGRAVARRRASRSTTAS